jgi:hypothetical protein
VSFVTPYINCTIVDALHDCATSAACLFPSVQQDNDKAPNTLR